MTPSLETRLLQIVHERYRRIRPKPPDPYLSIGPHSYPQRPRILRYGGDIERVDIGDYCSISGGAAIMPGGNHNGHWISTFPFRYHFNMPGALRDGHPTSRGPVLIGNDVWIGREALILSGVTVGDGAIVGARAVVTKDVRPYGIVAGNPAREVRRRFDDETVDNLLELKWWNWPEPIVREAISLLCSPDIGGLFRFALQRGLHQGISDREPTR